MVAVPLVVACYVLVNVAYLAVLSPVEMIRSTAVAVEVGNRMLGPVAFIIPVAVVLSVFGARLSSGFSNARLCLSAAREGHMVDVLSYLHVDSRTPVPALIFMDGLSVVMIRVSDMASVIEFFTFTVWLFYVTAMVLVLILRKIRPDDRRAYRVPLVLPVIVILAGLFLVVSPIISKPTVKYLYVLAAIGVGFIVYIPFVYKRLGSFGKSLFPVLINVFIDNPNCFIQVPSPG